MYPDVRAAGFNALGHFLVAGVSEGRLPSSQADRSTLGTVVIVSGEPNTPGHRYRVERLAEACTLLGYGTTVLDVPQAASSRLASVSKAVVLILWRTAWGTEVEAIVDHARRHQVPIVFDVDDLMIDPTLATTATVDGIRSQNLTEAEAADWFARMGRTAAAADACIVSTERIAEATRLLGTPTHVLPNGIDDSAAIQSSLARRTRDAMPDDGLIRIGYASGSRTHQRDFGVAAEAVVEVLMRNPQARPLSSRTR